MFIVYHQADNYGALLDKKLSKLIPNEWRIDEKGKPHFIDNGPRKEQTITASIGDDDVAD
jgi:hypothetical protein